MPNSPSSLCLDCNKRAINGTRYCADHQTKNNRTEYSKLFEQHRADDPIRKMYRTPRWQRVRSIVLHRDILCRVCGHKAATEADHIERARLIVEKYGKEEFYNPERIQGLCHDCHSSKTAVECGWAGPHSQTGQ